MVNFLIPQNYTKLTMKSTSYINYLRAQEFLFHYAISQTFPK